jgi:putative restriction endonuclease
LKHRELLDAAHIIPDNLPEGKSTIENGLSLCKLHHSAYDAFIIGVTPDYIIQVRADILEWNPSVSPKGHTSPKYDNENLG